MLSIVYIRSHKDFNLTISPETTSISGIKSRISAYKGYKEETLHVWRDSRELRDEEEVESGEELGLSMEKYEVVVRCMHKPTLSLQVSADMLWSELIQISLSAYHPNCSHGCFTHNEYSVISAEDQEIGDLGTGSELEFHPVAEVTVLTLLGTEIGRKYVCLGTVLTRLVSKTALDFILGPYVQAMTETGHVIGEGETLYSLGIEGNLRLYMINQLPKVNRSLDTS